MTINAQAADLLEMGFEDLLNVEVSSASKTPTRLMETAAAVSVINREDILRSGACAVPELLRMVPGVQVAQIDANRWAVTVRGFNGQTANKLLVMIDGRSVYTPTFSGTYWDALDVSIDEIERIEVIRGPGAALWGANAVNGVINIITQSAFTDKGTQVASWIGSNERAGVNLRQTVAPSENSSVALSARALVRDQGELEGRGSDHSTNLGRVGLRWDVRGADYSVQTSASYYQKEQTSTYNKMSIVAPYDTALTDEADLCGGHLRTRYSRYLSDDSTFDVQLYYDYSSRHEWLYDQRIQKFSLDLQHSIRLFDIHRVTWGATAELSLDYYRSSQGQINITPHHNRAHLLSFFVQDDYSLTEDIIFTLGAKFEHNEVTDWEVQPNLRLLWQANSQLSLWGAVSRAVRTPSHVEQSGDLILATEPQTGQLPVLVTLQGDSDIDSEDLLAWELGSRFAVSDCLSIDLALFQHDYDNLQGGKIQSQYLGLYDGQPVYFINYSANNHFDGRSYGAELAVDWCARPDWRLVLAYSFLDMKISPPEDDEISYPERYSQHQLSLQSRWDVTEQLKADCWITYTDGIAVQDIDDSWDLQLRLGWQANKSWNFELIGQNLLHDDKKEIDSELSSMISARSERGVMLRAHYRF
ncbi:MAG: TonB-dependent receptor [Desulfuromonas sp.]|nr:TonB-dependent receptor [Desulfuromonas sp.]